MSVNFSRRIGIMALAGSTAILAACAAAPPPPPPPPPPPAPVAVVIPPRPVAPGNAVAMMTIPQLGPDGVRETVNARLSPEQTVWNLRSALNVAALNCLNPEYSMMVPNYATFLERNKKGLTAANRALTKEFRERYGSAYRDEQDTYMTRVYNYYALPPAQSAFCDTAMEVSNETLTLVPEDLDTFAARNLPRIESVFEDFFRAYEQYRVNLAAWDAQYGPPTTSTLVADYGVNTNGVPPEEAGFGSESTTFVSGTAGAATTTGTNQPATNPVFVPGDGSVTPPAAMAGPVSAPGTGIIDAPPSDATVFVPSVEAGQPTMTANPVFVPGTGTQDAPTTDGTVFVSGTGESPPTATVSGEVVQPLPDEDEAEETPGAN